MKLIDPSAEWLETDGLGGFASGTVSGIRTRRHHALLMTATARLADRVALVKGFDAHVETAHGTFALSSQCYAPDVIDPDGATRIEFFHYEPWPRWRYRLTQELAIEQELFVPPGQTAVMLSWKIVGSDNDATLWVRPFFSGGEFHSTREKHAFRLHPEHEGERWIWRPDADLPAIVATASGSYIHEPIWYRNFFYTEDNARGLEATEDLESPGVFQFPLSRKPAVLMFETGDLLDQAGPIEMRFALLKTSERQRRKEFATPLHRAADAYVVQRDGGKTIVVGYPCSGDSAREVFISLRGLCLAAGRISDTRDILVQWSDLVSEGTLPDFNSVDASLWYVIAVGDYLQAVENDRDLVSDCHTEKLRAAIEAILTRIRADADGLLRVGEPGSEITHRIGKPVEIQALWLNALAIGAKVSARWAPIFEKGRHSFEDRFWNEEDECLYDIVDCDHQAGTTDSTFRPNQIFAIGGLPLMLLPLEKARQVVDAVEERLLTPMGLRSLAPDEPGFLGDSHEQGAVWPWLIGPFVEAWLRVRDNSDAAKAEAAERFVMPLIDHLHQAGLGHISEIAEADFPYAPAGCPFQARSLGEFLRLDSVL